MMYANDSLSPMNEAPDSAAEAGTGTSGQQPIWHSLFCHEEGDGSNDAESNA